MDHQPRISIFIQSAFDTNIIIDTSVSDATAYHNYAKKTIALLQESYPNATWIQEDTKTIQGPDDAIDFFPILNLSYVTALCTHFFVSNKLSIELPGEMICSVSFSVPIVYFQAFSAGIISFEALLSWNRPYTSADLLAVNNHILKEIAPLIEKNLFQLITAFVKAVHLSKVPLYELPFTNLMPATSERTLLYWTHFVYVAHVPNVKDIPAATEWLKPLMMPIDSNPVQNMALKPDRFIYFGWGRSMICCRDTYDSKKLYSYVRILEIRNYIWKTLYDLDRGLRSAIIQMRKVRSEQDARKLTGGLRALDFRVKEILEELDSFKMTFDHEKIWLIKQVDANWLTANLITSVESRLTSFCDFYDYSEETTKQKQESRLQLVLNLIAVIATAGTITEIINFFDPSNHLASVERISFFFVSIALILLVFLATVAIVRRERVGS